MSTIPDNRLIAQAYSTTQIWVNSWCHICLIVPCKLRDLAHAFISPSIGQCWTTDHRWGYWWLRNIFDTDKTLQTSFDSCYNAGPSKCAFYVSSPKAISQNLNKLYDITKIHPFPVFLNTTSYSIVDYNFLQTSIFASLYFPYLYFSPLSNGNVVPLWEYRSVTQACNGFSDPEIAITCNNGNLIPGTLDDAEQYFVKLAKTSDWADIWANSRITCLYVIFMPNLQQN